MVSDQHGTRLVPSKNIVSRVLGTTFFLVLASIMALTSAGIYYEVQSVDDPSSFSGCWNWQTEAIIGGNPPYCFYAPFSSVIESIEVSEDQHIREHIEDWESGDIYTEEYRWEDVGDSVVYGFIFDGRYDCMRFVPEFALPEDWVPADIDASFEYPEWCGSSVEGQEGRVYEEGAHPYDDVWMYEAYDVEAMSTFLDAHKITEDRFIPRYYTSKSFVEQDRAESEGEQFTLGTLFCTVPLTVLFLFGADQRPRVVVVDRQARTITRRRSGRFPSFSRTWSDVDFSATTVVRSIREKADWGSSGFDEVGSSTSSHPGLNIVIRYGQYQQVLLFFEDGGDVNVHGQVISDFMAAMGVEFNHHDIHEPQPEMYARPIASSQVNKGGSWGYGPVEDETPPVVSKDEKSTDDETIPSFWSIDEPREP